MDCRAARKAIVEHSLGLRATGLDGALCRHLEGCESCRAEHAVEQRLKLDLESLRGSFQHAIDVHGRVLREIGTLGGIEREVVPARQIGWAAAAALACCAALLGSLPWLLPEISPLLGQIKIMAATFGRVLAELVSPLISLITVPFKIMGLAYELAAVFFSQLSRLEPAAITAAACCYTAMAATITLVVGRDLKKTTPALPGREER
jgi:hypothetical protein